MAMRGARDIREGMEVYDVDGHKVGTVDEVAGGGAGYLKVKTGLLGLGGSSYIPVAAVREVRSDDIYLSVAKDDADRLGWNAPLTTDGRHGYAAIRETAANGDRTVTPGRTIDTDERRTVELREEELRAWKEPVQVGEVRVDKEVVTEQQTIDVPVTREEVVVEWHPVEGGRPATGPVGTNETIHVPVLAERAHADKQTVVTAELEVGKRAVIETEQLTDTVRREEAHIEREGDVQVSGDMAPRGDGRFRGAVPLRRP